MKTQHLCLEDGILEFMDDKIIITDKGRSLKFSKSVIFITSLIYPIATAIRGFREHDKDFFIFGILLSSFWIFVFIKETLKRIQSTEVFDNQIEMKDIIVITFQKKRLGADMKEKKHLEIIDTVKSGVLKTTWQTQNLKIYSHNMVSPFRLNSEQV